MFSKKESEMGNMDTAPVAQASTQRSTSKPGRPAAPSIFSSDVVIVGNLTSAGDIQFDGKIEGSIESGSLTIGESAIVKGEVKAENVSVKGRVVGSVYGQRVQLMSSSHVEGDVLHAALEVESGAYFEGNCRRAENPLSGSQTPRKPVQEDDLSAEPLPSALRAKAS